MLWFQNTVNITNLDDADRFARKMVADIYEKREQKNKYLMATKRKQSLIWSLINSLQ